MEEVYSKKENKKFLRTFDVSNYEILTDDGFKDLNSLHETIPYEVWKIKLSNGYELECADDHIVFDDQMNEIFVKNLEIGDKLKTDDDDAVVISIENLGYEETMFDFELSEYSNRRYFTNGILSHNTELAKQLARFMFDSDDSLIRIDMSEYTDKISVNRIIGSPSGYIGYEDSTILDKIRTKPYSVILFDEIEKAHPEVFNVFLQMLDDGHMTDSHGRKVSFKNCVILMTSNVGTRVVKEFGSGIGFSTKTSKEKEDENNKAVLEKELKKKFAPEFINRIDEIIYFRDLGKEEILKIVDIELSKSVKRASEIGFETIIDESVKDKLFEVGFQPEYGARPLKRAIQRWFDDPLTNYIIESSPKEGSKLYLTYDKTEDKILVSNKKFKK